MNVPVLPTPSLRESAGKKGGCETTHTSNCTHCAAIHTILKVKREKSRPAYDGGVSARAAPLSLTEELH